MHLRNKHFSIKKKNLLYAILCILFSTVGVVLLYRLWDFDFKVPLIYTDGDNMFTLATIKRSQSLKDFFITANLGAPFAGNNYDFPFAGDFFNILFFRILFGVFNDAAVAVNVGYFMLFPLTSLFSYMVMRNLKVDNLWSLLGSVTFAFLPYRMLRNTAHLFLNCFFQIPIAVLIMFWIINDDKFLQYGKGFFHYRRNWLGLIGFCFIAYTGIYYAFFIAFFVCITIIYKMFKNGKISYVTQGIISLLSICIPLIIAFTPYVIFQTIYGANAEKPIRSPLEAEIYGLKIVQFFIPVRDHGIKILKLLKNIYANAPVPNEGSEYLGIIGCIGFLLLIVCILIRSNSKIKLDENIQFLSVLNIFAVLLATIGGFGSIFALVISPQIRGYNRISVFVAYFAILAICMILTIMSPKKMLSIVVICAFLIGIAEQMDTVKISRQAMSDSYYSDKKFVSEIERNVADNAMIYQWVYQPFPENPPINNMGDYAGFRGYVHSSNLRWSYGDNKGRKSDLWNRELAAKSIQERIDIVSNVGFGGIYIDSYAYNEEELNELLNQIENILKRKPLVSEDGRLYFYNLNSYIEQYKNNFSEQEWNNMKYKNLFTISFSDGFYGQETDGENYWRWCSDKGILKVIKRDVNDMCVFSTKIHVESENAKLTIECNGKTKEYFIDGNDIEISIPLIDEVTNLCIYTNAKRVNAPNDSRELYMRFSNSCIEQS